MIAVLGRRYAQMPLEHLREVVCIRIADPNSDFPYRNISLLQQLNRTVDTVGGQVFKEGLVIRGAKKSVRSRTNSCPSPLPPDLATHPACNDAPATRKNWVQNVFPGLSPHTAGRLSGSSFSLRRQAVICALSKRLDQIIRSASPHGAYGVVEAVERQSGNTMWVSGMALWMIAAASRPFITGISISISTSCG